MRRAAALLLLSVWGLSIASPVFAQQQGPESVDQAKEYFRAGAQACAVGQYQVALQAFEQAYALAPRPAVLFSMAQAERRQYFVDQKPEHLERAIRMFRDYLNTDQQGTRRADAVQALSEIEPLFARMGGSGAAGQLQAPSAPTRIMVSSAADQARIWLDGVEYGSSPVIAEVPPGRHRLKVVASGYFEESRDLVAVEGALVTLDVPLRERPSELWIHAPSGVDITVDGRLQGTTPLPRALELPAGRHIIAATRSGFRGISREISTTSGEVRNIRVSLPRSHQRTLSLILLGASATSTVMGAFCAYYSENRDTAAKDFLDQRGTQAMAPDRLDLYNSARQDRDRFRAAALGAVGGGMILGIAGGLLYAFETPSVEPWQGLRKLPAEKTTTVPSPRAEIRLVPEVGIGWTGLGLQGTF